MSKPSEIGDFRMLVRPTVRVLLLDRDDRLLMIKCTNLGLTDSPPVFWATAGGGIEAGETIEAAARREVLEETGIFEIELGPVVWTEDAVLTFTGEPTTLFRLTYVVAHCTPTPLDSSHWTQQERDTILELRWWALGELRASAEHFYPAQLTQLLPDVLAGRFPAEPIVLMPR